MSETTESIPILKSDDSCSDNTTYRNDTEDELFQSAVADLTLGNEASDGDDILGSNFSESETLPPQLANCPPNGIVQLDEDMDDNTISEGLVHDEDSNHTNEITLNNVPQLTNGQYEDVQNNIPELETVCSKPKLPSVPDNDTKPVNNHEEESTDQFIEISLVEASKIGDGMSSYVTYKIETKTNIGLFRRKSFSVNRRFSDFLGLHDKLVEKYLRAGRIIPPAPEKNAIATTKVKMYSNQSEQGGSSTEFVERRRASLERYLRRTVAHPVLRLDPDFRDFLESDGDLPRAINTSALSGAGVKRLFNKVGITVNKMAFKMEENDPWFEEKLVLVDTVCTQLRRLHNSVDTLVFNRKELAVNTSQFAKSAAVLSNCEEHTGLSRALSQLADVEEKVEAVHNEQANSDFSILCELLKDYICLLGAVKDIFHERVKVYQNWQHALMMLNKKREAKIKMENTGQIDKVNSAASEVAEWSAKVDRNEEEFQKISKVIKSEYEHFEANRIKEFKSFIVSYLESLVTHQEQLMKHWEGFLPEAKAIV